MNNVVLIIAISSTMYVLNEFNKALRSFISVHAALDVEVKFPIVKQNVNGHVRFYTAKDLQNLVGKLMENLKTIERCLYSSGYISIWFKKELWTSTVIKEILDSGCSYGSNMVYKGTTISINTDVNDDSVTCLRSTLLKNVIQNIAKLNGCIIESNGINLVVSKKNNLKNNNIILCGNVICNSTAEKYKQKKQNVITKMSENRIESNEYPINIILKLCHVSIVYELLSVRHNKVINTERNTSNKDDGIFIMYNYSRLCQIWKAYEKGVIENYYKPLPDVDSINFGLLSSEEEWILILNYLSACPIVIQDSVKYLLSNIVDVHKLCKFLMGMSSAVSLFYHRHHILSDPITTLLPLMYARLYLVKMLIQVYENVFQLLDIEAVSEM